MNFLQALGRFLQLDWKNVLTDLFMEWYHMQCVVSPLCAHFLVSLLFDILNQPHLQAFPLLAFPLMPMLFCFSSCSHSFSFRFFASPSPAVSVVYLFPLHFTLLLPSCLIFPVCLSVFHMQTHSKMRHRSIVFLAEIYPPCTCKAYTFLPFICSPDTLAD